MDSSLAAILLATVAAAAVTVLLVGAEAAWHRFDLRSVLALLARRFSLIALNPAEGLVGRTSAYSSRGAAALLHAAQRSEDDPLGAPDEAIEDGREHWVGTPEIHRALSYGRREQTSDLRTATDSKPVADGSGGNR